MASASRADDALNEISKMCSVSRVRSSGKMQLVGGELIHRSARSALSMPARSCTGGGRGTERALKHAFGRQIALGRSARCRGVQVLEARFERLYAHGRRLFLSPLTSNCGPCTDPSCPPVHRRGPALNSTRPASVLQSATSCERLVAWGSLHERRGSQPMSLGIQCAPVSSKSARKSVTNCQLTFAEAAIDGSRYWQIRVCSV